jgi:hypothetical protein
VVVVVRSDAALDWASGDCGRAGPVHFGVSYYDGRIPKEDAMTLPPEILTFVTNTDRLSRGCKMGEYAYIYDPSKDVLVRADIHAKRAEEKKGVGE